MISLSHLTEVRSTCKKLNTSNVYNLMSLQMSLCPLLRPPTAWLPHPGRQILKSSGDLENWWGSPADLFPLMTW